MPDVTYLDPPNDPEQPLELGAFEPIEFTCARPLLALYIDQGGATPEVAYYDGAFVGPYAALSEVDGLDVTVLRSGGWLAPPLLRPRLEVPVVPLPADGQAMGTIYEIDFTAQTPQTLGAAGAYTIDGKTWYAKAPNASQFGSNLVSEVTASGLSIRETVGGTGNHNAGNGGSVALLARHLFMPLAQLPLFNPNAPLMVRFKCFGGVTGGNSSCPVVGLASTTDDGVAMTAAHRVWDHLVDGYAYNASLKRGIANPSGALVPGGTIDYRTYEVGIYQPLEGYEVGVYRAAWSGTFSIAGTMRLNAAVVPWEMPSARPNVGIFLGFDGQSNLTPCGISHLQLSQPKVVL